MQTFDAFAIGDTIFIPSVRQKDIPVTCPDCMGEKLWNISTPSGVSTTIGCPRCGGGEHNWLIPKRYERCVEINEAQIVGLSISYKKGYKSEELHTRIEYDTRPYIGGVNHDKAYLSREAAEIAGAALLADDEKSDHEVWRKERKRAQERAGQDILTAFRAEAEKHARALDQKIDKLKDEMREAIEYPSLYGPKLTRPTSSYSSPEITTQAMAEWCNHLLSEADIEGWSESELHEMSCHC